VKPRAAANRTSIELAAIWDAALVELGVEPDPVEELEPLLPEPVPVAEAPEAVELAAPEVGEPKRVTPDGTGEGRAEAEAPTPTRKPLP